MGEVFLSNWRSDSSYSHVAGSASYICRCALRNETGGFLGHQGLNQVYNKRIVGVNENEETRHENLSG